jgi:dUTP pyrophosphatase
LLLLALLSPFCFNHQLVKRKNILKIKSHLTNKMSHQDSNILLVKLVNGARELTSGSEKAAGLDLHALVPIDIAPGQRVKCATGVHIRLPPNTFGRIEPRSGLALKYGLQILGGVIDEDYTGELSVLLLNSGDVPVHFDAGDRFAQLVVIPIVYPNVIYVDDLCDLGKTIRGSSGFGSSGL